MRRKPSVRPLRPPLAPSPIEASEAWRDLRRRYKTIKDEGNQGWRLAFPSFVRKLQTAMGLRRGYLVRDVNDRAVGVVTDVADRSFAVRVNDSHLWLLADAIFYVAENAAKLICSADEIRRYQVDMSESQDR